MKFTDINHILKCNDSDIIEKYVTVFTVDNGCVIE